MDLEQMLGIDLTDPQQRLAHDLVDADDRLLAQLTALREAAGVSQEEVGRRMGVGQSAVARIESGERDPRLSTIRRYAHAVGAAVTHNVRSVHSDEGAAARRVDEHLSVHDLVKVGRKEPKWEPVDELASLLVRHSK